MNHSVLILLVLFTIIGRVAVEIVCPVPKCTNVDCSGSPTSCDDPNTELGPGGFCGCCTQCVHILKENETCFLFVGGTSPPSSKCADGLDCIAAKCQKKLKCT